MIYCKRRVIHECKGALKGLAGRDRWVKDAGDQCGILESTGREVSDGSIPLRCLYIWWLRLTEVVILYTHTYFSSTHSYSQISTKILIQSLIINLESKYPNSVISHKAKHQHTNPNSNTHVQDPIENNREQTEADGQEQTLVGRTRDQAG